MIDSRTGNLLEAGTDTLVNTVNCVGVMGKGIALASKEAYPSNFAQYRDACDAGVMVPGRVLVHETGSLWNPRFIINFPTKRHWKGKSRLEDVRAGLPDLVRAVREHGIQSIAIPPLGCGNGGLDWSEVRPLIVEAFADLPHVTVALYEPAPPDATAVPGLGRSRALLLALMDSYGALGFDFSAREVHGLAYLLQAAGEPLRLAFEPRPDGLHAAKLEPVLRAMEGWIEDGAHGELRLRPGASCEAARVIASAPGAPEVRTRVADLIQGFESPRGIQALAAVHWAAADGAGSTLARAGATWPSLTEPAAARHLHTAWERLKEHRWVGAPAAQPRLRRAG